MCSTSTTNLLIQYLAQMLDRCRESEHLMWMNFGVVIDCLGSEETKPTAANPDIIYVRDDCCRLKVLVLREIQHIGREDVVVFSNEALDVKLQSFQCTSSVGLLSVDDPLQKCCESVDNCLHV